MARKRRGQPVHGWIVLDKHSGMTSTRAVTEVRRLYGAAKAGHAGTLDPLATGVLPIALGEATKTLSYIVDASKDYRFRVRWGEERDTDDADGSVTAASTVRPSHVQILEILPAFVGEIEQVPPVYSALKVAGERAYDLAREGRPASLPPRRVRIDRLTLIDAPEPDHAVLEMSCGKGTYVRSLARDIGRALGCLGHVAALRRTRVGPFDETQAISLDKLASLRHKEPLAKVMLPVETALADIPALAMTGAEASRLKCGQVVRVPSTLQGTVCATANGKPIAVGYVDGGELRPVRVFNLSSQE